MSTLDLDAFLGAYADTLTDQQRDEITSAAEHIEKAYPKDDFNDEREAMLTGIMQATLGDSDLAAAVREWHMANQAQARALARMRGAITVEVARTSELAVANTYGIARPTVRKALGK